MMPSDVIVTTIFSLKQVPPGALLSFSAANELMARMYCVKHGYAEVVIFEHSTGGLTCWIPKEVKK